MSSDWIININNRGLGKILIKASVGLPHWLSGKESICLTGDIGDAVQSLGWKEPLEESMQPTSVFLPGRISWTEEPGIQSIGSQRVMHDRGN